MIDRQTETDRQKDRKIEGKQNITNWSDQTVA